MPGIYLHIPFCKKACHYCNFHFSTSQRLREPMLAAILRELDLQKNYLGGAELTSVYFGGGTPSILTIKELEKIFQKIQDLHLLTADAEITLEANPDDLTREHIFDLRNATPINRLSIGIQSFFDEDLQWMNRAHSAAESRICLENALAAGFDNLTIDLIYGSPTTPDSRWLANLQTAFSVGVPHFSAYCLTVEEGTALGNFVKRGKQPPMDEEQAARQFEVLVERAEAAGFEHYEISNFARPGRRARHNSNYWLGENYLGIGPSAHSFDQVSRQWNISNNSLYIKSLEAGAVPFEQEILTPANRFNEFVMTSLRTSWGCDLAKIEAMGGEFATHFLKKIQPAMAARQVVRRGDNFVIARSGKFFADRIAADLFA